MATDVKNDIGLSTNLVSYWEMEESSGTRVDSHGSNDLTENSDSTIGSATGIQGNASDHARSNNDYLSVADDSSLSPSGDWSFNVWLNADSQPANNTEYKILYKYAGSPNREYFLVYRSVGSTDQIHFDVSGSGSNRVTGQYSQILSTGTWFMVTAVFTASTDIEVFVNASSIGSTSHSFSSINDATNQFRLGAESGLGGGWDGQMDEVGFWSKALSTSEISDLYNSGSGIPYDAGGAAPTFIPKTIIM